jgi:hypothetical protein
MPERSLPPAIRNSKLPVRSFHLKKILTLVGSISLTISPQTVKTFE